MSKPEQARYLVPDGFSRRWLHWRVGKFLCWLFHRHHPEGWIMTGVPRGSVAFCYQCAWAFRVGKGEVPVTDAAQDIGG